jgi:23S rRNA G2069 N7-methylase RlmK/C1962 C5-methylase RlmI
MSVVHMKCGGETPEARHNRIMDDRMEWESRQENRERHGETRFLNFDQRESERLKVVCNQFQNEISLLKSRIAELEFRKIHGGIPLNSGDCYPAWRVFQSENVRFLGYGKPHVPDIEERVFHAFDQGYKAGLRDHEADFELPEGAHIAAMELHEPEDVE